MSADVLPSQEEIARALSFDRPPLTKLAGRIRKARSSGKPFDRNLARLEQSLAKSIELAEKRRASVPAISYPDDLPIATRRDDIAAALAQSQVIVVCGETGSGKSTQLPKLLLELGYGVDGAIGHTQPRRLAARSLAKRVAQELPGGQKLVGSKVRFADDTTPATLIKLMTDGMLLAETAGDRSLLRYSALILDEAHERSLNIDFLLGYLRRLLPLRPELAVIITSATIDTERFAEYFAVGGKPAPVVEVSGRTYPVELRYRPPEADEETGEIDEPRAVAAAVEECLSHGPGDVLVFLPTQRDIAETATVLSGRRWPRHEQIEVLQLFGRLPMEQQAKVFAPSALRRVVLSTNVAESSVTVPGVHFVVDTGTARISRYSPRARIQRLPIEAVSQASANQRMGRCGRLGPGLCLRLYAEDDFAEREAHPMPEVQRCNLAAVILQMTALGLGRVEDFPFLDAPRGAMVRDGYRTLSELGALDNTGSLTDIGKQLSRLPVDPRIGRMILAAGELGCLEPVLTLAAVLEVGDPRLRPAGQSAAADEAHARFADVDSDFTILLNIWEHYSQLRSELTRRRADKACNALFLSAHRCREWADVRRQLSELAKETLPSSAGVSVSGCDFKGAGDPVHQALLTGLLCNVAQIGEGHEYIGADGKALYLWPGSSQLAKKPRWIVAAEIVETTRRYARIVARISPREIEPVAGELLEHNWRDPFWDRPSGRVMAIEKVTLWGLPVVPRRRGPYDLVNPVLSRELFIRHGLAEGQLETGAPFLAHNMGLANQIAGLEARSRRRDLLADLDARYDFYDRRLPAEVVGAVAFHHWRRLAEKVDPHLLHMTVEDLLQGDADSISSESFPDDMMAASARLPLRYHLAPGESDDGVTVSVPVSLLDQIDNERLQWLVPGMLREKVIALMRTLPKEIRRQLVPIPTRADGLLEQLAFGQGDLLAALAEALTKVIGRPVLVSNFSPAQLPDHLRMTVEVLDDDDRVLDHDRDLRKLRSRLGSEARAAVARWVDPAWQRSGSTKWDFGELPEEVFVPGGRGAEAGAQVRAWPTLIDEGKTVGLSLAGRAEEAKRLTADGLTRLVRLSVEGRLSHRLQRLPGWNAFVLEHAAMVGRHGGEQPGLLEQLVDRLVRLTWLEAVPPVRNKAAFTELLQFGDVRLPEVCDRVMAVTADVLAAHREARQSLDG
ncbi:MAG: ATP-dependent helicase HrpA, partial [Pseudohongiellaceae bacterium]